MTPNLKATTFRLEAELLDALQEIKERDGVPVTEQVRRGILLWLKSKGVKVEALRQRASTHRRG
ncbi:MAG: ribbon-helix-helix protein, CopG family [Vicinamibacterales bacterium]|jgi:hypothetical protein|nr:ribbon-helix-helix protein, CopG family [Vicinamibacterales bacterium]